MRIIVSDPCCMIDLQKAALLDEVLRLPYTFVMPAPLFNDEWLSLSTGEKASLRDLGLEVRDLPGPKVSARRRTSTGIGVSNSMAVLPWCLPRN